MATVDRTIAEDMFEEWADCWELDLETGVDDEESKSSLNVQKTQMLRAIENGRLSFDATSEALTFTTRDGETLEFNVPKGGAYLDMDRVKDRESMKKIYNFMGAMTGKNAVTFSKMDDRDCKVCRAITTLFMTG